MGTCFDEFDSGQKQWEGVYMMGRCFKIVTDRNATGRHLQKRIFQPFKNLLWIYVLDGGGVPKDSENTPITHFWAKTREMCFDKLVLKCFDKAHRGFFFHFFTKVFKLYVDAPVEVAVSRQPDFQPHHFASLFGDLLIVPGAINTDIINIFRSL